jgi:hypothetical protein
MTADDFTNQFVNDRANALLPYHPEYPRLQFAEGTLAPANVYNWINSFNNVETYAAALAAGYIMVSNATIIDPFYTVAPSLKAAMETSVTSNYAGSGFSMWQMARDRCVVKMHWINRLVLPMEVIIFRLLPI